MDAPARTSKAAAQKDRELVATTMRFHPRSSWLDVCSDAIKHLRNGGAALSLPGSASIADNIDMAKLATMRKVQLRELANKTPGVVRNKKNEKGQWIPKTCAELKKDLAQALPGSGHLAGAHTTCVTQAAGSDCLVVVRVVKTPWCDDMAAGLKFFECVGNQKGRRVNPFNSLKAGDLCVVVRSKDNKKVTAVAEVQGPQRLEQTDRNLLLQHLQPGRHDEIQNFLGDAPSFNVVFFSKVYDCSHLNLTLPLLVRKIPGLQEPGQLAGSPALNRSEDTQQRRKELRDALEHFLTISESPLRCAPAFGDMGLSRSASSTAAICTTEERPQQSGSSCGGSWPS